MSAVNFVATPKVKDLGDGFQVRRSLPMAKKRMVGPFIFWDHMGPVVLQGAKEMRVRAHPHIGLATITYLFSGQILHRDSLGNEQWIRPGEVNWMTAGQGIVHSETSYSKGDPLTLEGIQLWVALPKKYEDVESNFFHCKPAELPSFMSGQSQLILIAGEWGEYKSPVPVYSDLFYLTGKLNTGAGFESKLKNNQEAALYVLNGEVEVEGATFTKYSLIIFNSGTQITFKSLKDAEFMIFGGEIYPEERHIWWNFVSSDQGKIEVAKQKWAKKQFPPVPNETEFIPLPEN